MAEVPLFCGAVALVDDEDLPLVSGMKWRKAKGKNGTFYAATGRGVLMHRLILGETTLFVDHWNRDGLDNRRHNLRRCTNSQNMANQAKRAGTTSRFKGVTRTTCGGNWAAAIEHEGKKVGLGVFADEARAARQYDRAARLFFGEFARTNEMLGLY